MAACTILRRHTRGMATAAPRQRMYRSPLLQSLSRELRLRHYSDATARTYIRWVVRYVRYHGMCHPSGLDRDKVVEFLSALAIRNRVTASTQNQAMAAISFLTARYWERHWRNWSRSLGPNRLSECQSY